MLASLLSGFKEFAPYRGKNTSTLSTPELYLLEPQRCSGREKSLEANTDRSYFLVKLFNNRKSHNHIITEKQTRSPVVG
jgi:hypothetical protein